MPVDGFLIGFALSAGAASFFSPCSVGLLPAYVGYFFGSGSGAAAATEANPGLSSRKESPGLTGALQGGLLGLLASSGFFLVFGGVGGLVALIGTSLVGPYLRWISIAIGAIIVGLGVLFLLGRLPSVRLPIRAPRGRTPLSILLFGAAYGLASLGCTLPLFLSTLLLSLTAGGAAAALLIVLAYAAGMAAVMIVATAALAVSETGVRVYLRRIVPHVQIVSSALMLGAGVVIIAYYTVIWR